MRTLRLLLLVAFGVAEPAVHAATRPNIVVILADDLGYGDVQALNPQRGRIKTPHLDRLAREGMTFTDAHSGSAVCTPTRYGLLTGRYAWRTRLQHGVIDGFQPPLIAAERLTLPAMLRGAGYHTAVIGKWHLGFTLDSGEKGTRKKPGEASAPVGARILDGPLTRGFDYFYGVQHARSMGTFFEQDRAVELVKPVDALGRLTERASRYIAERARAGQPFFLYFALTSPHTPIVPSAAWRGKSGLGNYADFVMETDAAAGEILAALERAGVAANTLVIAASDNGCSPQAGTDDLEAKGHFASAQFRGYKADIWEGGHRVPFFVRWPGTIRAGARSAQVICLGDLMATCAELLGLRLPDTAAEDSVSFLPALHGIDRTPLREAVVHHSIEGRFAIRQGKWKLALCPGSGGWGKPGDRDARAQGLPPVQLYDLAADPGETRNVHAEHPEIVSQLRRLLERYVAEGRSTPGAKQKNDTTVSLETPPRP